jgi:hypothetical protein
LVDWPKSCIYRAPGESGTRSAPNRSARLRQTLTPKAPAGQQRNHPMNMKILGLLASLLILSGCMVTARPGGGISVVPILPAVVELGDDSYYAQGGYHYYYTNDRWFYSNTRGGERMELPRSHWPRETHYRNGRH